MKNHFVIFTNLYLLISKDCCLHQITDDTFEVAVTNKTPPTFTLRWF